MAKHEIGLVYRRNEKFFIAVNETTLVNGEKGLVSEIRPHSKYDLVRNITVEELCEAWDVSLDQFDVLMQGYLSPADVEIKARPRGSRKNKKVDDDYWRRHRTGRITRSKL